MIKIGASSWNKDVKPGSTIAKVFTALKTGMVIKTVKGYRPQNEEFG